MAKFWRVHNRSISDIFRDMIAPRAKMLIQDVAQKWVTFCKISHTYHNRTGALENSISWTKIIRTLTGFSTTIEAGGLSEVKYAYDFSLRTGLGLRLRNRRFTISSTRASSQVYGNVSPGDLIMVDYALHVENKGYPVLAQGEEYIKSMPQYENIRIMKLPKAA